MLILTLPWQLKEISEEASVYDFEKTSNKTVRNSLLVFHINKGTNRISIINAIIK